MSKTYIVIPVIASLSLQTSKTLLSFHFKVVIRKLKTTFSFRSPYWFFRDPRGPWRPAWSTQSRGRLAPNPTGSTWPARYGPLRERRQWQWGETFVRDGPGCSPYPDQLLLAVLHFQLQFLCCAVIEKYGFSPLLTIHFFLDSFRESLSIG